MDKITTRPQRVVVVVQRHSVLPGHLGLRVDVEHVLEEAHQLEVSLGQVSHFSWNFSLDFLTGTEVFILFTKLKFTI